MAVVLQLTVAIMTARTAGVIVIVAAAVHRHLCNALMAAGFITRIALRPGQPVQLLSALANLDTRDIWTATAMVSAANDTRTPRLGLGVCPAGWMLMSSCLRSFFPMDVSNVSFPTICNKSGVTGYDNIAAINALCQFEGTERTSMNYSAMTDAEIADGWIAEISENDGVVDPDRTLDIAFMLSDYIYHDPTRAWSIIRRISQSDMSCWAQENFSAGPLTDFISQHGGNFAEQIRTYCRDHPRFHDLLLGAVFQEDVAEILRGTTNTS